MSLRKTIYITILTLLIFAPLLGLVLPVIEVLFPLAIAFQVPADGPPFAEVLLPLIGVLTMAAGVPSLAIYLITKQRIKIFLRLYCFGMMLYSFLAGSIWVVYHGFRFVNYFFITDIGFYLQFLFLFAPHIIWIIFLFKFLRLLKEPPKPPPDIAPLTTEP